MRRKGEHVEYDTFGDAIADIGFKQAAAILGRRGGKARTKAKVAAARENGRKGGRPRKDKPP